MTNTITFKWATGNIEIAACAVLDMTATQLKALVKTATANAEEVKNQIADYIQSEIDKLNPKSEYDKKMIAQYNKLISAACGERRQTAQEKAIARILKNVPNTRESFMGIIEDAGKHCVLDGFRLVRFSAPFDGFPTVNTTFDTNKAIGDKSRYNIKLALPTVKDLKADMKIAKLSGMDVNRIHVIRKGKRLDFGYDFGYGMPMVNAKWLIDMIEALPDAAAYAVKDYSCNPIYFTDGENDGILLPIRKMQEYAAAPADEEKTVEAVEEKPIEKPVEDPAPVESDAEKELEAERERRRKIAEQENIVRGNEIADELAKAEQKIISSGYIENKNLYGKLLFLRLFDKYGVKVAIRSRGWIIDKLKSVNQHTDGSANISFSATRKGEKVSHGFWDAYVELRDILIKAHEESASNDTVDTVDTVDETVDTAAINRVVAVAIAVNDGAHDLKAIVDYIHMYGNDMITEDEAKDALLRYTVPLALPAHEEAAQDTAAPETIQIAFVIHPAVLRPSAKHYRQLSARSRLPARRTIRVYHIEPDSTTHVSTMNNAFCLNSS